MANAALLLVQASEAQDNYRTPRPGWNVLYSRILFRGTICNVHIVVNLQQESQGVHGTTISMVVFHLS